MSRFAIAVLLLAAVTPCRSSAEPKKPAVLKFAPFGVTLGSEREHGTMKIDCEGDPPFREMVCRFSNVTISQATVPDPVDIEAEVDRTLRSVGEKGGWSKFCADVVGKPHRDSTTENEPVGRSQMAAAAWSLLAQQCACADDECRRVNLRRLITSPYDGVCKVFQFVSLPQIFKRTGKRTWMATTEAPACNVVTVTVLEHEPDSEYAWTFTQTRSGKPDLSNPFCAAMELNKPLVYSWRFHPDTLLQCRAITFD